MSTADSPGATITAISGPSGPGTITDPSEASVTVTPTGGVATATVTLSAPADTTPLSAEPIQTTASSSGYVDQTNNAGTLRIEAGEVDTVTNAGLPITSVRAPWLDEDGTHVQLTGAGFCPGTGVAIGDPNNPAVPTSISSDGTSLTFSTPPSAITGPIEVIPPSGHTFDGPKLTVSSFRNTWGFSISNSVNYNTLLSQDMEDQLFGKQETNINVFGWLVRKPEAYEFQTITNNHVGGGLCFGFAYSSNEFYDYPGELASFPSLGGTASDPFDIGTFHQPDLQNLINFIVERFSLQFTDQLIPYELNAAIGIHGTNDDLNAIEQGLASHEPVLVSMIHWDGVSVAGHTVLAYRTRQLPDGSTAVDVLNSNEPYQASEESKPSEHDLSEFTNSEIIINNGNWTFPEGADFADSGGKPWSGSEADLVVYPHSALPIINGQQPKLPNVFTGAALVVFGSSADGVTQLSGSTGGALFKNARLTPQSDWPKGAAPLPGFTSHPGPLQLVAMKESTGSVTATVHRGGGGAMSMRLPGLDASLQAGVHPGQIDTVSVNPRAGSIAYGTSARRASLGGTLLSSAAPGAAARAAAADASLSDRMVQFKTSVARTGQDTIAFPSGGQLSLHHTGPAAPLSLTLSSFNSSGEPVAVSLPPMRLASGETLQVAPTNWRSLATSKIRLRELVHGHSTTVFVKGRTLGRRFASAGHLSLRALGHGRYAVEFGLRISKAPDAWLSVKAVITRGHRTLATSLPTQLIGTTLRNGVAAIPVTHKLPHGHYKITVRLLEVSGTGPVQGSAFATRVSLARV